jgi:hypothetical protein
VDKLVPGFDYVTGKEVSRSAAEWRQAFPPSKYRRDVHQGETWYRVSNGNGGLVAEAYAVIPAGKG